MGFFDVVTKREGRVHPVWGWDLLHAILAWGVYMLLLWIPTFFAVQWAPEPSAVFASLLVLIGVLFVERAQAKQRGWSLDSTADLLSYQGLHLPASSSSIRSGRSASRVCCSSAISSCGWSRGRSRGDDVGGYRLLLGVEQTGMNSAKGISKKLDLARQGFLPTDLNTTGVLLRIEWWLRTRSYRLTEGERRSLEKRREKLNGR
jgi:hypothetical protein